jgi:hypothetical protein
MEVKNRTPCVQHKASQLLIVKGLRQHGQVLGRDFAVDLAR